MVEDAHSFWQVGLHFGPLFHKVIWSPCRKQTYHFLSLGDRLDEH
jgi:hypothetical protein